MCWCCVGWTCNRIWKAVSIRCAIRFSMCRATCPCPRLPPPRRRCRNQINARSQSSTMTETHTPKITPAKKPPRSLKRFAQRMSRMLVTAYLIICCLVYLAQDWMAFPGWWEQGKPDTKILYGREGQTLHFKTKKWHPDHRCFWCRIET